ncbi:MAG: NUDIX hydrolase [Candidatus Obscuribacterales bacterium]
MYMRPWKRISSEKIADCRVFTVHKQLATRSCTTGEGERTHDFYVFHSGDWVNVIPITEDNRVVLIEQFRHGTENFTLEIPGGSVDMSDPDPLFAAERELLEETGYQAEEWTPLGTTHPNPAIQSNRCHTYLARNIRQVRTPVFNTTEEIAIRLVPVVEIPELIKTGVITHALVMVAFYWLDIHKGQ